MLFPFPCTMLSMQFLARGSGNQRARRNCSSSGADRLRSARARSRRACSSAHRPSLVARQCGRDRLSKPSGNALNPFKIRRVQFRDRPSYGRPYTYPPGAEGRKQPAGRQGYIRKRRGQQQRPKKQQIPRRLGGASVGPPTAGILDDSVEARGGRTACVIRWLRGTFFRGYTKKGRGTIHG